MRSIGLGVLMVVFQEQIETVSVRSAAPTPCSSLSPTPASPVRAISNPVDGDLKHEVVDPLQHHTVVVVRGGSGLDRGK